MNAYVVTLTIPEALTESRADDMLDALAEHDAAMSIGVSESSVTLTLDAESLSAAAGRAVTLVEEHAEVAPFTRKPNGRATCANSVRYPPDGRAGTLSLHRRMWPVGTYVSDEGGER